MAVVKIHMLGLYSVVREKEGGWLLLLVFDGWRPKM